MQANARARTNAHHTAIIQDNNVCCMLNLQMAQIGEAADGIRHPCQLIFM
jgi:hypothetical protein